VSPAQRASLRREHLHLELSYKRLEEGTFRLPAAKNAGASVELKASELAMLLAGIDLTSIKRRRRFALRAGS
jgi:transposase